MYSSSPVLVILTYVYIVMNDNSRNRKAREKHTCLLSTYLTAAVQFHSVTVLHINVQRRRPAQNICDTWLVLISGCTCNPGEDYAGMSITLAGIVCLKVNEVQCQCGILEGPYSPGE